MTTTSPPFDINQLNAEQQKIYHTVYNELKPHHESYMQYKLNLTLNKTYDMEEEENEWHYEVHRFLRARRWHVAHTIKAMLDMIKWRMENHVDSILENKTVELRVELLRKTVPSAHHGYTKADRPLYIEKSGLIHVDKVLHLFTAEELLEAHIFELEYMCQLARERSRQIGKHVDTFVMLSDLHGCKLEIRKVFHLFRQSLYVDENYYPERLGQMIVINPPIIFPILWNIVKHWLDPVTQTKIIVIKRGPETASQLLHHIDASNLPSEYGGTCNSCSKFPDCIPIYDWSKDPDNIVHKKNEG